MTETPRPDPWEDVGREIVGLGDLRMAERLLAVVNAARAAEAERHQQTEERAIAAEQQAFMLATRIEQERKDAATLRATVDQQQARIAELATALKQVTDGMDRAGGDRDGMPECPWCRFGTSADLIEGYSHGAGCELVAARQALETP